MKYFDPEFLVKSETIFECKACLMVVKDPKSCPECDEIFCKACINKLKNNVCPTCRAPEINKVLGLRFNRHLNN